MKPLPLKLRLAAWYFAVMAVSYFCFSVVADVALEESIRKTLETSLHAEADGVRDVIVRSLPVGMKDVEDDLSDNADLSGGGYLFQVAETETGWIYRSPGLSSVEKLPEPSTPTKFRKVRIGHSKYLATAQSYTIAGRNFRVQVAAPTGPFDGAVARFRLILVLCFPVLVLLASLGGYWLSRRALEPVNTMIETARNLDARDLSARLTVPLTRDELARLAETFNAALARIQAAVERITRFTADASHELRTPVSVVRTSAELALRRSRSEAQYRESLEQILREAEKTSQLIEDLLTLARSDAASASLPRRRTNLADCAQRACSREAVLAEAKPVHFTSRVPPEPVWVDGDAAALERLILILLDNAVKYTPEKGRVEMTLREGDGWALAEVRDTGIGIPAEDLANIFERFYRADPARARQSGGTGLGLSIARWIAEAHGGEIRVQSEPGKGSVFEVRLPLVHDE